MGRPARPITARSVGQGAAQFMATTFEARVVGTFDNGFYIGHCGQLMAVVDPSIPDGPLYLGMSERIAPPTVGTEVEVERDVLGVAGLRIQTATSPVYRPTVPTAVAGSALLAGLTPTVPAALADSWPLVVAALETDDLASVQRLLCGRGAGSTPEGDDVLAGLFLVLAGDGDNQFLLAELAVSCQTSDLSRAFLRWAAVGQSVEHVHRLLAAAGREDRAAFAEAAHRVSDIGGSTGKAMLCGMQLATAYRTQAPLG